MSGYVDIHAHVIPEIDDGPRNLEAALDMLRAAAASGIATIAATPHLRSDFPAVDVRRLAEHCDGLRAHLASESIDLELVSGGEVALGWALDASDEDLRLASYGQRGIHLLIETPSVVVGFDTLLNEVEARGFKVVLAHPERSRELQDDPTPLVALANRGILLQINAETLLGDRQRSATARLGAELCLEGLAHVIASDGHRAESWRPVTNLRAGVERASELVGAQRAQWMACAAPAAIVAGQALPEPPRVVLAPSPRRWWRRHSG